MVKKDNVVLINEMVNMNIDMKDIDTYLKIWNMKLNDPEGYKKFLKGIEEIALDLMNVAREIYEEMEWKYMNMVQLK